MKHLILLLLAATSLMAQSVGGVSVGGGGTGSGTVSDGAATDVPCYTDTNTVGPCSTGAFYFNTALIVPTGAGAGLKIGDGDTGLQEQSDDVLDIITNGATRFAISVNIADFAVPVSFPDGSASAPGLRFRSDTNTGIYRVGADSIGFAANGANVATLDSTGFTVGTAGANFLTAEGATADAFELSLAATDPTADRTITFPDATGTVPLLDDTATFSNKTFTAPLISGKADMDAGAVNDDDCTGEQGWFWYDDTDSAFEFCNANSGTPTTLGGGSTPERITLYHNSGTMASAGDITVTTGGSTSTSATTVVSIDIPADTFVVDDVLYIEALWSKSGTTGSWRTDITWDGAGNPISSGSTLTSGNLVIHQTATVYFTGTGAQITIFTQNTSGTGFTTLRNVDAIDETTIITLGFRVQTVDAADTATLDAFTVERMRNQ